MNSAFSDFWRTPGSQLELSEVQGCALGIFGDPQPLWGLLQGLRGLFNVFGNILPWKTEFMVQCRSMKRNNVLQHSSSHWKKKNMILPFKVTLQTLIETVADYF